MLTFGAKAISPETGYGYIQYIESNDLIKSVKKFVEKPKIDLAKKYIKKGNYLWNTGIFMF